MLCVIAFEIVSHHLAVRKKGWRTDSFLPLLIRLSWPIDIVVVVVVVELPQTPPDGHRNARAARGRRTR